MNDVTPWVLLCVAAGSSSFVGTLAAWWTVRRWSR